jgi:hypothetical protein
VVIGNASALPIVSHHGFRGIRADDGALQPHPGGDPFEGGQASIPRIATSCGFHFGEGLLGEAAVLLPGP